MVALEGLDSATPSSNGADGGLAAWKDADFCRDELGRESPFTAIDEDRLNVDGGAVAAGHPVGSSGARIVLHLLKYLIFSITYIFNIFSGSHNRSISATIRAVNFDSSSPAAMIKRYPVIGVKGLIPTSFG